MAIPSESFEVQSESPVDFASLRRNGMNLESIISVQEMFPYFDMLNGPTYFTLVKDFWARAEVYDLEAALAEEDDTVIRSSVMGIPITITEEVIAKACRVSANGRFLEC